MFLNSTEEQFRLSANYEFEQIHRRGMLMSGWSLLAGKRRGLPQIDESRQEHRYQSRSEIGIQTVSIRQIRGSEGRGADFDRAWRPLRSDSKERWTSIASAQMREVGLPAVDLIKIGEVYFVRDGHHRISVARTRGQVEIEANVIEWQCGEAPCDSQKTRVSPRTTLAQRLPAFGGRRIATMASKMNQEFSVRIANILGRTRKDRSAQSAIA